MSNADVVVTKERPKRAARSVAPSEPTAGQSPDAEAEAFEQRVKDQMDAQFQRLKDEARALFGMVNGRPGVRNQAEWEKRLGQASDDIGSGRFVVRCLGAERYLDAETVAVLITLRQNLIAELGRTSTFDLMMIDSAIIAYYNMIRVQGWIGNSALVVEGELFGQAALNEIHGAMLGERLAEQINRLTGGLIPIQERCQRMMNRSLAPLRHSGRSD
jgi:hypothetical protein